MEPGDKTVFSCRDNQCMDAGDHGIWCYYWKPKVVCLCGSTRFAKEFMEVQFALTLEGKIVLTVGGFPRNPDGTWDTRKVTQEQKFLLDKLHFKKIEMADEIYVINVDGYIGPSTSCEISHARTLGKKIRWLVEPIGKMTCRHGIDTLLPCEECRAGWGKVGT